MGLRARDQAFIFEGQECNRMVDVADHESVQVVPVSHLKTSCKGHAPTHGRTVEFGKQR